MLENLVEVWFKITHDAEGFAKGKFDLDEFRKKPLIFLTTCEGGGGMRPGPSPTVSAEA